MLLVDLHFVTEVHAPQKPRARVFFVRAAWVREPRSGVPSPRSESRIGSELAPDRLTLEVGSESGPGTRIEMSALVLPDACHPGISFRSESAAPNRPDRLGMGPEVQVD